MREALQRLLGQDALQKAVEGDPKLQILAAINANLASLAKSLDLAARTQAPVFYFCQEGTNMKLMQQVVAKVGNAKPGQIVQLTREEYAVAVKLRRF